MEHIKLLGIDIAKNIFHLHGIDGQGKKVFQKKVSRDKFLETLINTDCEVIVMEACGGANHWARQLKKHNCSVKLISPQFVKPFLKGNKNDWKDAEAICEAASRSNMVFVEPLTEERQDIQSIHRVRQGLIDIRTACGNRIRGLLAEYGQIVPMGIHKLTQMLPEILENESGYLTPIVRTIVSQEFEGLRELSKRIKEYDKMLEAICENTPLCQKLIKIPGIGVINASILFVKLGSGLSFNNGRHFAAYLGLVPKQHSSGGKNTLLGISKRGDCYVRKNLIHAARSILRVAIGKKDQLSEWAVKLCCKKKNNVVIAALANKLARIAWAIARNNTEFITRATA
jgi:transposase